MGKGSKRRPSEISEEQLAENYARIFGHSGVKRGESALVVIDEQSEIDLPAAARKPAIMYEAILWIGNRGSWSQGEHATPEEARDAAIHEALQMGDRGDLRIEVQDGNGNTIPGFESQHLTRLLSDEAQRLMKLVDGVDAFGGTDAGGRAR